MASPLQRKLVVVTGKGGVGKTTVTAALALLASRRGIRTIVVEVGEHGRLAGIFGVPKGSEGAEVQLAPELWGTTIDPDRVLLEWVQELGGRIPGKVLASSGTFQYFAAAAPGAKELFTMVKLWELTQPRRWQRRASGYDLVLLDAPATGHALGMLRAPRTFGAIARVGPVAAQAKRVRELLLDEARSAYIAVTLASEMSASETIDLDEGLQEELERPLDAVLVNGLLPRRFNGAELERIAALDGAVPAGKDRNARLRHAAAHAAVAVHERARQQANQVARLRRRGFDVVPVPFVWEAGLGLEAVEQIAAQLERRL